VLASVGIYALAAAANEVTTSGNERQNTQTHYLADYGVQATARAVAGQMAQTFLNIATLPVPPATTLPSCTSVPIPSGVTPPAASLACAQFRSSDLAKSWTQPQATLQYGTGAGTAPYAQGVVPGSFGLTPVAGDFFVELTAPEQAGAPAGFSQDSPLCIIQFTATVSGFTQPLSSSTGAISYEGEGIEMQRARVLGGPVTCPTWGPPK
jgi:hypothetical protein